MRGSVRRRKGGFSRRAGCPQLPHARPEAVRFQHRSGGLFATDLDARIVARSDAEYPELLEHLADPPQRLWVAGRDLATLPPCVAIVGTRTPTHYGEEIAQGIASDLARSNLCVVSGLARGVDAWAHAGALATARYGLDCGREVFAVPGDVRVDVSAGVHGLLRDGAALCTGSADILERIRPELDRAAARRTLEPVPEGMDADAVRVLALLGGEAMTLGSLIVASGLAARELSIAVSGLELGGWVARGPGSLVRRVR
ncbi:MAG: DNA-processing protein DprA [Actinobacteria bacterium]|nr:MAG: DNA-processing protein DprA [Actinomycetota bacterium]